MASILKKSWKDPKKKHVTSVADRERQEHLRETLKQKKSSVKEVMVEIKNKKREYFKKMKQEKEARVLLKKKNSKKSKVAK